MSNVQFRLVGVFAIEELSALADRFIAPPRQDEQLKRLGVVESWGQGAMVTAACVGDGLTLASRSVRSMIQSFLDVYKARSTQSTVEYFDIEKSVLQVLGNDPEFWKALRTPAPSPVDGVDSILLPANKEPPLASGQNLVKWVGANAAVGAGCDGFDIFVQRSYLDVQCYGFSYRQAKNVSRVGGASPPPSTDDQVAFQQSLAQKGFIGDIVIPDFNNSARWEGYASSSYMGRVPFLVLFPADSAAVQLAVTATKQFNAERTQDLKVVARSGGHQYSGTSLGNSTTIVVNMEKIAFEWHQEIPIRRKWRSNDATIIDVKPALRLRELSAELKDRKMMIPHGECPEVAIGGHAQTGGYGHLLRSYGLTVDQVRSFSIVLADGKEYSIVHPSFPAAQKVHKDNDQLFRGVLSGSAGSFGIVTEYSFEGISDMSNPRVASYTAVVPYSRENLEAIMHEVQEITKKEANGEVPSSCDLFISVESRGNLNVVSPVILVEAADCNAASHDPIPNATHPFWQGDRILTRTTSGT